MSVPADMLKRLSESQTPALPGGGQAGPAGAPINAPQQKDGARETARVHVHIGMNMLEQALGPFGSESKEGKVILAVLSKLANAFGDTNATDLIPAQLKEAVQSEPRMGGGNPMQQKLMQVMQQQHQQPPGGGAQRMPPMQ